MKSKVLAVGAVVGGLLLGSGRVFAHHSNAVYDTQHPVTLTGTVTEFGFFNPHAIVHFQVKDDRGNVEEWVASTAPPNVLHRSGWTRNTIKPGDQVTLSVNVARNGRKEAHIVKIAVNGKVLRGAEGDDGGGQYQSGAR